MLNPTDKTSYKLNMRGKRTFKPLNANPTKWSNTLKQFVGNLPTNCLIVFDHFVGLAFKGLNVTAYYQFHLFLYISKE